MDDVRDQLVGAFLLAMLPASRTVRERHLLPPLLGTGVLSGFTTLSAASEQARALVASGATLTAAAYVVGALAACLVGVAAADRIVPLAARLTMAEEEGDL